MEIPFFWVLFFFLSYFSGVFRKACAGGLVWLAVNRILTFIMQQNWVNRVTFTTLIFKINISEIYLTAEYWMNMHERPELVCVWSARRCKCIFQASALCCLPTAWWPWRKVSAVPRELPRQRHRKLRQIFLFNIWVHCNIPSVLQIVCVFQRKAGPESQWIYSLWSLGPSLESPTRPLPLSRQSYLTLQRAVERGSGLEQENYTYFLHLISQRKYKILLPTQQVWNSSCRYWVVLGVFSLVELMLDLVINPLPYSFPSYLIIKCGFLAWCMAPVEWNGSDVIFNNVSIKLWCCKEALGCVIISSSQSVL